MLYKVIHFAGCVSANTRPHQLRWGDQEMGTAIECSQMAGLIQKVVENPRKHCLFMQLFMSHSHTAYIAPPKCGMRDATYVGRWVKHEGC